MTIDIYLHRPYIMLSAKKTEDSFISGKIEWWSKSDYRVRKEHGLLLSLRRFIPAEKNRKVDFRRFLLFLTEGHNYIFGFLVNVEGRFLRGI